MVNEFANSIFTHKALSVVLQDDVTEYEDSIVNLVNHLLGEAIQKDVSDIHIEPFENSARIRFRHDGLLHEKVTLPSNIATRLVTRLKVMAQLDIAERRLPQDGRISLTVPYSVDVRMNTCPTLFGEKVVLRLLDKHKTGLSLDALGFTENQHQFFLQQISAPQGLILVTGPTGSGKTVTLYSALRYLNTNEKNISTAEDPIEIQLDGINQVNIHTRIGLDFPTVLRTFLRQDPDIIMVGEIRDKETAKIAIQAAQTGHLVLSTLHTKNAAESFSRLQNFGIAKNDIVNTIILIIGQRLVRKICAYCKTHLDCSECSAGYKGRIGVYEFLSPNQKFHTLRDMALQKVAAGVTTLEEINRVIPESTLCFS